MRRDNEELLQKTNADSIKQRGYALLERIYKVTKVDFVMDNWNVYLDARERLMKFGITKLRWSEICHVRVKICHFYYSVYESDIRVLERLLDEIEPKPLRAEAECPDKDHKDDDQDNDECGASSKDLFAQFANVRAVYEAGQLYEIDPIAMIKVIYSFNTFCSYSICDELKLQRAIQEHSV